MQGTLDIGAKHWALEGVAALIHARLAEWADWFNYGGRCGQVVIDFGHGEVATKRTESFPTIRLDDSD